MAYARKNTVVAGQTPAVPAADAGEHASPEAKRLPVRTLREGDCNASIWSRAVTAQGAKRVYYSVTLERSYKDSSTGQFRYTKSFAPESLSKIALLCQQAQEAIAELPAQ